jgi:hypothetical protein
MIEKPRRTWGQKKLAKAPFRRQVRGQEQGKREQAEADADDDPLVHALGGARGDDDAEQLGAAGDHDRRADLQRVVAPHPAEEDRDQIGRGVDAEADGQVEDAGEDEGRLS